MLLTLMLPTADVSVMPPAPDVVMPIGVLDATRSMPDVGAGGALAGPATLNVRLTLGCITMALPPKAPAT